MDSQASCLQAAHDSDYWWQELRQTGETRMGTLRLDSDQSCICGLKASVFPKAAVAF